MIKSICLNCVLRHIETHTLSLHRIRITVPIKCIYTKNEAKPSFFCFSVHIYRLRSRLYPHDIYVFSYYIQLNFICNKNLCIYINKYIVQYYILAHSSAINYYNDESLSIYSLILIFSLSLSLLF